MIKTKGKSIEEVVEEIFSLLVKQGGRCVDEDGSCMYGDSEGNHCAIGFLVGDEFADYENSFSALVRDKSAELGENGVFMAMNLNTLSLCQKMHDTNNNGRLGVSLHTIYSALQGSLKSIPPSLDKWVELRTLQIEEGKRSSKQQQIKAR